MAPQLAGRRFDIGRREPDRKAVVVDLADARGAPHRGFEPCAKLREGVLGDVGAEPGEPFVAAHADQRQDGRPVRGSHVIGQRLQKGRSAA